MPRKNKRKDGGGPRGGGAAGRRANGSESVCGDLGSDDECARSIETMSVVSCASDFNTDGSDNQDLPVDSAANSQEIIEEKLVENIDALSEKSMKTRQDALNSINAALTSRILTDFISGRKVGLADALSRCISRGKCEECKSACRCVVLLLVQLGSSAEQLEVSEYLTKVLRQTLADTSSPCASRAAAAETLGMMSFLLDVEHQVIEEVMTSLENVFRGSYLKGDGSVPSVTLDVSTLHASALTAWSLLVTLLPSCIVDRIINKQLVKLSELLLSTDVELRITAGETIALLYELARFNDEEFESSCHEKLCESLRGLSTECNKYRAKRDRKQQRSSFRDILSYIEDFEYSSQLIRMKDESLNLDCWTMKSRYDAVCHFLATGMKTHLQENELVRDIFGLGPAPLLTNGRTAARSKEDRHYQHSAAFKQRTKCRSKQRDKKSQSCGQAD